MKRFCSTPKGAPRLVVPFLDLEPQYRAIKEEIWEAIQRVIDKQQFILGPEVEALEEEIAAYCGCRHAVGVSSGTDALLCVLMALDLSPGDEIITTPYSFFATAGVIHRLGCRPVFVDIDRNTYNIDPQRLRDYLDKETVYDHSMKGPRSRSTGRPIRAVIPVHLFGRCADMNQIMSIGERYGLRIIEDAAQAIGATSSGRPAGSMGLAGCFSFFPSKNLGGYGDGGMVTTDSEPLAEKLRILRVHGSRPKYYHQMVGGNFRLDALQAAVLRVKLRHLDRWSSERRAHAAFYDDAFVTSGLVEEGMVLTPYCWMTDKDTEAVYNQYVIRARDRDGLRRYLYEEGIGTEIYYPRPLHLQPCFSYLGYSEGDLPVSEEAARETLAVPIYPGLTSEQKSYVVEKIREYYSRR